MLDFGDLTCYGNASSSTETFSLILGLTNSNLAKFLNCMIQTLIQTPIVTQIAQLSYFDHNSLILTSIYMIPNFSVRGLIDLSHMKMS